MRYLTVFLIFISFSNISAQNDNVTEDLFFYGDVMLNAIEYQNRQKAGDKFYAAFKSYLDEGNAFELTSGDIKTISVLEGEMSEFKLVTWQVRYLENRSRYYGFVLFPDGSYVELNDNTELTNDLAYDVVSLDNWYGALYYGMRKLDDSRYIVFGYNQIDEFKNAKVLDIIEVKDSNVSFGAEIFEDKYALDTYQNRIILTYSADASVNLNYNPGLEMIIHDHLIQRMGKLEGQGPVNVPDGTYEGYAFIDDKWRYKEKIYNHSYGINNAPRPKPVLGGKKKKSIFGK